MMLEMTQRVPFMGLLREMDDFRLWKVGSLDPRKMVIVTIFLRMTLVEEIAHTAVLATIGQGRFVGIVIVQSDFAECVIVYLSLKRVVIFASHI